ncbi:MAG TPA: putative lipid II flippase FtsW [Blastocatellia bacterium]|nr:putative lipid II flippase FtsW [Blastocatellia bacterium]
MKMRPFNITRSGMDSERLLHYSIRTPEVRNPIGPRWKRETELERRRAASLESVRALPVDKAMLAIVLALTLFGAVMVYSASAILAQKSYGDQFYFLYRQGAWAVIGLIAMAIAMRIDYRHYKRPVVIYSLLAATLVMLVVVLFLPKVNETHRWIRYGAYVSLQPSEVAKVALGAFLAFFLESRAKGIDSFKRTFLPATLVAGAVIALIGAEPDLGTALAIGMVFLAIMFQAGTRVLYLATLAIPVVPALVYMLLVPWRFQRIMAFLDPWKYQATYGFQPVQSMIAIGSGGANGVGFAQGKQKMFYLPAPHTDFIFAVIGEELGLIGAATIVALFAVLAWRGFRAARFAPDTFGQLLAVGLTVMIIAQAFFNVSVTLSLVPTKGIPLPFISAGGSSLAISLFAAGVLLNISKHAKA